MIVQPLTIHPLLHVVEHMRSRDRQEALMLSPGLSMIEWAHNVLDSGGDNFVFATNDGEPVMAGGWVKDKTADGVRWSWLVGTPKLPVLGAALHRFAVRMHDAMEADGVRRFLTLCLDDSNAAASRWLERLGYQQQPETITCAKGRLVAWMREGAAHG